jgi:hypothetical protein
MYLVMINKRVPRITVGACGLGPRAANNKSMIDNSMVHPSSTLHTANPRAVSGGSEIKLSSHAC